MSKDSDGSEEYACYVLASWTRHVTQIIIAKVVNTKQISSDRRCLAGDIATRLRLSETYLDSLPPYMIDAGIEKLSLDIIISLAGLCSWPQKHDSRKDLRHFHDKISRYFLREKKWFEKDPVVACFGDVASQDFLDDLNAQCLELHDRLSQDGIDDGNSLPGNALGADGKVQLIELSRDLFDKLEAYSQCDQDADPCWHEAGGDEDRFGLHPARLSLEQDEETEHPSLSFIISTMNMDYWQDFNLTMRPECGIDALPSPLRWKSFCEPLQMQYYNSVRLLYEPSGRQLLYHGHQELFEIPGSGRGETLSDIIRNYRLTPKHKLKLAYWVTNSYWKFYDSDLMRRKWTSDSIWFQPLAEGGVSSADEVLLKPYVTLPFGVLGEPLEDFVNDESLDHQYPRIFCVGILLLQIGLGEVFPSIRRRNPVSQLNLDHHIALKLLEKLRQTAWAGFRNKSYFDNAVAHCLDGRRLIKQQQTSGQKGALDDVAKQSQEEITKRRKDFYKNVVKPLRWLAVTGFRHRPGEVNRIRRSEANPFTNETLVASSQIEQIGSAFHTKSNVIPSQWLQQLKAINGKIAGYRRKPEVKKLEIESIRVAILDTGLDLSFPDFEKRASRVIRSRDFTGGTEAVDEFGHGSFMASILMNCAPAAEIIVARVARNTPELDRSQENIKKAILWAGREGKADVISMSFGFPRDHKGISDAIYDIQSERGGNVVFLASGGNSPSEDESFPARHPSVISIHATNYYGTFAETTANPRDDRPVFLGTYGDFPLDKDSGIYQKYPKVCQPGSSVATAVAAGISATIMAYANVLPHLEGVKGQVFGSDIDMLLLLRKSGGMEALLKHEKMIQKKGPRQWFVDPISFWRNTENGSSHFARFSAIYNCLHELSKKIS